MEFTSADIFHHSPFGDILNSLRSLSLSGESWLNYVRQDWDADDEEIRRPPTTHLVATVDDLTDMLDFDSEDIDGMDTGSAFQDPDTFKRARSNRQLDHLARSERVAMWPPPQSQPNGETRATRT